MTNNRLSFYFHLIVCVIRSSLYQNLLGSNKQLLQIMVMSFIIIFSHFKFYNDVYVRVKMYWNFSTCSIGHLSKLSWQLVCWVLNITRNFKYDLFFIQNCLFHLLVEIIRIEFCYKVLYVLTMFLDSCTFNFLNFVSLILSCRILRSLF